jgi:hypothetical protein
MSSAPYGVRLLVGAAATAIEETLRLPLASHIAQLFMKVQQDVADLVIKGDEALEQLFPPKDEQAEWATFDEDLSDDLADHTAPASTTLIDGARLTEGRFALYSDGAVETTSVHTNGATITTDVPQIVEELDYPALTLAQLRARLTSLKLADLEALLTYENLTKARAPFQTLLSNRITRATAK